MPSVSNAAYNLVPCCIDITKPSLLLFSDVELVKVSLCVVDTGPQSHWPCLWDQSVMDEVFALARPGHLTMVGLMILHRSDVVDVGVKLVLASK